MSMIFTAVVLAASIAAAAPQEPRPEVTIYRSWRAPNITVVEGMFRVDPELLETATCSYGVELTVRDSEGTQLTRENWTGTCPEQDGRLAAALETFEFQIVPAAYTVEVAVYPAADPARRRTTTLEVRGLAQNPLVSDLILARDVAFVDSADARQWTIRRGTIGMQLSSQLIVRPDDPRLSYYLELYADEDVPMTGSVAGIVRRADGRELTRVTLLTLNNQTVPRPVAGTLPVPGLPDGMYTFETHVQLADTTIVSSHPFTVAPAATVAATGTGWFGTLSDEEFGELFDPVVVWLKALTSASSAQLYETLPRHAQREFLAQQFGREGPTPGDGDDSALDAYLERVRVVNSRFVQRAGRGTQQPWRTDRGRIYLILGEPGSTVLRPSPPSRAPYEIWQYPSGQGLVYLFADDTRMGHYRLIFTNDPNEQSVPDWSRLVASEALEDLARLGIRPTGTSQ
jgi:GWxTD domain-containing protein